MTRLKERIATLEDQIQALKMRQRRVDARRRSLDSQRERREDTRRKILVGALILTQVERGDYPKEKLHKALDQYLTRPDDKALFGL
jgi:hypothetical protein